MVRLDREGYVYHKEYPTLKAAEAEVSKLLTRKIKCYVAPRTTGHANKDKEYIVFRKR
ncbi:MAG: hypothetical protein WC525_09725 [Candidatus Thermoplasmatota archaeon]